MKHQHNMPKCYNNKNNNSKPKEYEELIEQMLTPMWNQEKMEKVRFRGRVLKILQVGHKFFVLYVRARIRF